MPLGAGIRRVCDLPGPESRNRGPTGELENDLRKPNAEPSLGYSKRFGIVHVDFETQKRTPNDSARLYAKIVASRGRVLSEPETEPGAV